MHIELFPIPEDSAKRFRPVLKIGHSDVLLKCRKCLSITDIMSIT